MDKTQLISYLERIDAALRGQALLCVYGAAPFILLDEPERTSLDIDVAAPYSQADLADLRHAAGEAGLPINPDETSASDHIEWISGLRLCLPKPNPQTEVRLWQGSKLEIRTVSMPELIASKLIRYDAIDRSDVQYLCSQSRIQLSQIRDGVRVLPEPFNSDPLVLENLKNLEADMAMWSGAPL